MGRLVSAVVILALLCVPAIAAEQRPVKPDQGAQPGGIPQPTPATPLPPRTFRDCPVCPEMVIVPAGSFNMGSQPGDEMHTVNEEMEHEVTIAAPLAVGRFEVTFAEWDACVADGGCGGYLPSDYDWGRGDRPVILVSWYDAKAYIKWLTHKTRKRYRLLSEAEWEYTVRAGTDTSYSWGSDIGTNNANCYGCGSDWDNQQTAPVGSFSPNGFGLYDMHGNVAEWVEDCWHQRYTDPFRDAPDDGSAWTTDCYYDGHWRAVRGGSWLVSPAKVRSASRDRTMLMQGARAGD